MERLNVEDQVLVNRFLQGSESSFEELIRRYQTKVYNLSMRLTRNREDAEEVLQDVFVTVYRKIGGFEGKAKFSSWLYRITVNAAFMKLRKRKQNHAVALGDLLTQFDDQEDLRGEQFYWRSDYRVFGGEIRNALYLAIQKLPADYRAVFILRDIDGLPNKEVGELLELTIPAVKSRLHRSRLMLRRRLYRFYEDYRSETKIIALGPQLMQKAA